ncbi:MAG: hypothetical protein ACTS5I_03815, partial [Rhodanobacter sp.]
YYASALKIAPEEPSVLSNLGLSYVLARDLPKAEEIMRRANSRADAAQRVRLNLALVVGLQGRLAEAESIVKADRSAEEAALDAPAATATPVAVAVPAAAGKMPRPVRETASASSEGSSIRVDIDKVDALINMMGELVITQSMLSDIGENFELSQLERLREGLVQLERTTRELQESVMRIRMLPIASVFNRFPRMVHDLERKLGKQVKLELHGEHTELDKTVLEKIGDPMVHLVRNAIDHGLESPEKRRAAGKSDAGTLRLNAYHEGSNIVVQISDDGAGLN